MSWHNKIVWTEGLFLGPQHFQQQERYLEAYAHKRVSPLTPFYWGFEKYQIDHESLSLGKLVLSGVTTGIFQDGTPFDAPAQTPMPPPLTIRGEHLEQNIYLALPVRTPHTEETTFDDEAASLARYTVVDEELRDANAIGLGPRLVQLAQLRLRLLPEKEVTDAWIAMPIAKVSALHSDGSITLDPRLIPPVTAYGTSPVLTDWITKVHGLTQLRAQALSTRLTGEGKAEGAADVADFMLLQILNRHEPLLDHLLNVRESHPESIYRLLSGYAGELSTFITSTRRPKSWPSYRHLDPYHSFKNLVDLLLAMLNEVLIRSAERIELQARPHGVHLAVVDATTLQSFSGLVLAVSATMPLEELAQRFPLQSKFGSSIQLPQLVRSHLPGISISALPVPPRQIPFSTGFVYYELNRVGPMWDNVLKHGGLGMYIAEVFPGLNIELWGIRNK
ncbi:MAG: type VI secretion system baseplate subunit TssK [Zoogloeaceae bacterium]|jgi:type VI secretion system protein ImpJ|nr:type VI secretion system baseplate subunit TssK [Zoogloeaceae bacterium]